jgi:hypothetical protein
VVGLGTAFGLRAQVEHGPDPELAECRHVVARELGQLGRAVQHPRLYPPAVARRESADVPQVRQRRKLDQVPGSVLAAIPTSVLAGFSSSGENSPDWTTHPATNGRIAGSPVSAT